MSCPVCGAKCVCRNRGPFGECCGCHRHKSQLGMTREQVDDWRLRHQLEPVEDAQWRRSFARHVAPLFQNI
jgi:hypothetical protein